MFAAMFGRRPYGNELSPAEKTTLLKAVHGTPTAEIATTMHRSAHTVKSHLKAAYRKLGVSNRAAAGMKLLSMGLL